MTSRRSLGPGFHRLWGASALSNLADGAFVVALPLLAAQLTRSPGLVAGVALAERLPWLLFALVAGALADRLDRRRTMVNVQLLRVAVIGGLAAAVALDLASLPMVYAAAIVLGVGETLFDTAAQSAITAVVARDDLSRANGRLYAAEATANQFLGPALGGALAGVAAIGLVLAFGASALCFGLAAALLALLRGAFKPERPDAPARLHAEIAEGLRYLAGHRVLRTLAIMTGVQNLANTAWFSIFVLYAVGPGSALELSRGAYGLLFTFMGAGGVLGSLIAPRLERWLGRSNVLALAIVAGATAAATPAVTSLVPLIAAAFVLSSVGVVIWNVVAVSLRQRITPDRLLGRVNAGYRLLAWGSMPLGAALGGAVAELLGLRAVFALSGAIVCSMLLLRPLVSDRALHAAERASEVAAVPGPA
ncbi:MAG TPA: MFS transporter [Actinomycetes bacterium]|nr:MFS transporter [Actinomycetes bacterium]